jgi:tRNA threonylcarbamoyladenosine biosynthesis protein TsaB
MATGHAERLMPMIEEVMAEAGLSFHQLDRIAVTHGPGTFTGTRISVAAARALSMATGAKIVDVSSLEVMARSPRLPAGPGTIFAVATDARRDEVYLQLFCRFTLRPVAPPAVVPLADIGAAVQSIGGIEIAGSGAEKAAAAARAAGCEAVAICPDLLPDALEILFSSSEMPVADTVSPLYLRPPDAKPPAPSALLGVPA